MFCSGNSRCIPSIHTNLAVEPKMQTMWFTIFSANMIQFRYYSKYVLCIAWKQAE